MPDTTRSPRSLLGALAALAVLLAPPPGALAAAPASPALQQAGHGTVPNTGAAAPGGFATAEREPDPVIVGIEELRRLLADTGRKYKKLKDADKADTQRELLAALTRARAELVAAHELTEAR